MTSAGTQREHTDDHPQATTTTDGGARHTHPLPVRKHQPSMDGGASRDRNEHLLVVYLEHLLWVGGWWGPPWNARICAHTSVRKVGKGRESVYASHVPTTGWYNIESWRYSMSRNRPSMPNTPHASSLVMGTFVKNTM